MKIIPDIQYEYRVVWERRTGWHFSGWRPQCETFESLLDATTYAEGLRCEDHSRSVVVQRRPKRTPWETV